MQVKSRNHSIDSIFSFLLLLIFCLFTLMLAGMGSTIYRNGAAYLDENYTSRTAAAYISEKVRQHDEAGGVFLTSVREEANDADAAATGTAISDAGTAVTGTVTSNAGIAVTESGTSGAGGTSAPELSGSTAAQTSGLSESGEIPALGFLDEIEGSAYVTYVYFYDNALCELMIQKGREPEAAMGSHIVKLSALSIEQVPGTDMLNVAVSSEKGNSLSVLIHVSSGLTRNGDFHEKE